MMEKLDIEGSGHFRNDPIITDRPFQPGTINRRTTI